MKKVVSHLTTFSEKGCTIAAQKKIVFLANSERNQWLCNMDEDVVQQGSGSYTTRIRWLYNKDKEVMFPTGL